MAGSPTTSPSFWGTFWRNQLRQWHWISSAISLMGLALFAVTGFTLNHASQIEAKPQIVTIEKDLTAEGLVAMASVADKMPLSVAQTAAIKLATGVDVGKTAPDVDDDEIYLAMPQPGIDATMTIDRHDGHIVYERTDRGLIAVLNDLHKGRHSGAVWSLFIDLIAVACVVFSITGLGLLWLYSKGRRITWPLVAFGLLAPFILFLLFVHA
ncbi:PepSY-associated TM helix domain-containing protein [Asticcacaulis benevestitus]|uniref:Peptidase n=1 Tax=Asticcacaulis benevestitus DSM 16100 = ATCC BAA-896 TaxID=1121022 RepID=V4RTB9_9CAUL|nr:PepSY-associated TM helix domain-containing protein [Asticcacaulis benevestitus]ESQ94413.1 hypothetical protein ABENE_00935 [Asticcacaulis benevestitus DSM 16100 = ATCC BAA-896]